LLRWLRRGLALDGLYRGDVLSVFRVNWLYVLIGVEFLLSDFIEGFRRAFSGLSSVLVVTHSNADPDAVASAVIALRVLEHLGSRGCVGVPEGPSKVSRALLERLSVGLELCSDNTFYEGCVVVDSSNPVQLGSFKDPCLSARVRALVDHHEVGLLHEMMSLKLVDTRATSTTELMVMVAEGVGLKLDGRVATLAMAGIVYDSRRFQEVGPYTFRVASTLLDWGCDYDLALKSLVVERSEAEELSRRVATLKALSRLRVEKTCHDLLVAVTHIGSHESDVARTLVNLGADVAVVLAEREGRARASVRVSGRALEKGVKASTIAGYIAVKHKGEGGGHEAVAMAHIQLEEDVEKVVDSIARSLPGKISRICQEIAATNN
jgi:nanoRNase/pAp phosphatase (c-di-AMP/oligoRNAs hydrolase)